MRPPRSKRGIETAPIRRPAFASTTPCLTTIDPNAVASSCPYNHSYNGYRSPHLYTDGVTVDSGAQGWTAVVLTASSERQADAYRAGIQRRVESGRIASGTRYLVVPDPDGRPLGSGGATLHALAELARQAGASPDSWWAASRVLMIHSGGESRRLPQYAASGKLFGVLPARTPGESSTVFDEMLEAAARLGGAHSLGTSGGFRRRGAALRCRGSGLAAPGHHRHRHAAAGGRGAEHGVYVTDGEGLVYKFLQKPAPAEVEAAGGLLPGGQVALDTGLLFFDSRIAARLTELGRASQILPLDLYEHFTKALTGQWTGEGGLPARLSAALDGVRFSCSLVSGEFTHIGTTQHFRSAASAAGGVLDSVLGGTLRARRGCGGPRMPPGGRRQSRTRVGASRAHRASGVR